MTADQCRACPMPDQTAALELVRLREGIGRLRGYYADPSVLTHDGLLMDLDALLDDNEGEGK